MVTFNNALAVAHRAGNMHLQLQAFEGLGSIELKKRRYGDAVGHLEQALALLDHIKVDSGKSRGRIMEKLLKASEMLEQTKGSIVEEVQEGCLAIGPNARERFMADGTEEHVVSTSASALSKDEGFSLSEQESRDGANAVAQLHHNKWSNEQQTVFLCHKQSQSNML